MNAQQQIRILILGAGYAGVCAASRLIQQLGQDVPCRITVIDQRKTFTQRIRLHQRSAGQHIAGFDFATILARKGVVFIEGRVERIDLEAKRVELKDANGQAGSLGYDYLVYALGSRTNLSLTPARPGDWHFDTPEGVDDFYRKISGLGRGKIAVVGGGLTAIETVTELAERFPNIQFSIFTGGALLKDYSSRARQHLLCWLERAGIVIHEYHPVMRISKEQVIMDSAGQHPFDLCLDLTGFEPHPLARQCGLPVTGNGKIRVNAYLQADGYPEIFVAGDAAAVYFPDGRPLRMSCQAAMPMGAQAGQNLGRLLRGLTPVTFSYAVWWRCISLGRHDGIVQMTTVDDRPIRRALLGRPAALFKEFICQAAYRLPMLELRYGLPLVWWPKGPVLFHTAPQQTFNPEELAL